MNPVNVILDPIGTFRMCCIKKVLGVMKHAEASLSSVADVTRGLD